jgi:hypothetical protein
MRTSFLLLVSLIVVCCSSRNHSAENKTSLFNVYQLDTLKYLLNKDMGKVKKLQYPQDVILSDTTFESEDDLKWNGVVFSTTNEDIFFVEANWQSINIVKRVAVLSNAIVGLNKIRVGSKFKDIKLNLSKTIPSYPDGYFGLRDVSNDRITYFFDVEQDSALSFGNVTFETIPDDLTVIQILIE